MSVATVAIAEDEADLREAVAEYLSGHGYRVLSARDAASFRDLAGREPIHVAVLDISMPGEDGLSLARWLMDQARPGSSSPARMAPTSTGSSAWSSARTTMW